MPAETMVGAEWAFDAVYAPVDTQFLTDVGTAGLSVISGCEFFFQSVHAGSHFSGLPLDKAALRAALIENEGTAEHLQSPLPGNLREKLEANSGAGFHGD